MAPVWRRPDSHRLTGADCRRATQFSSVIRLRRPPVGPSPGPPERRVEASEAAVAAGGSGSLRPAFPSHAYSGVRKHSPQFQEIAPARRHHSIRFLCCCKALGLCLSRRGTLLSLESNAQPFFGVKSRIPVMMAMPRGSSPSVRLFLWGVRRPGASTFERHSGSVVPLCGLTCNANGSHRNCRTAGWLCPGLPLCEDPARLFVTVKFSQPAFFNSYFN